MPRNSYFIRAHGSGFAPGLGMLYMSELSIPPTAAELWQLSRDLELMFWCVKRLGINPGDLPRIRMEVGDMATDTEKAAAVKCRICFEALDSNAKAQGSGLCYECWMTRPSVYMEATDAI
jgi:hypothetical protein